MMASCCHKTSTILIIFFLCYFLCLKRKCMMHPKCFSIEAYTIFMLPMVSKHTTPNGPPSPHGEPNFCRQEVGVSLFSLSLSRNPISGKIIVYSRSTINTYSLLSHEWWVLLIKFMVGSTIYVRGGSMHLWYSGST